MSLSEFSVSRLRSGAYRLEPGSNPFELMQHLLRLFRSLDSWLGWDDGAVRPWLATPNLDLGRAAIELIASIRRPIRTADHVDALHACT